MDNRTTCVKVYPLTTLIGVGDKAEDGSRLRPYIVVFGEYVDSMNVAVYIICMDDFSENKTATSEQSHCGRYFLLI